MALDLLNGKSAIVAGGGRGIGNAISRVLAGAGASVAVADIERDRAEATAAEIIEKGGKAIPLAVDLFKNDQVEGMVRDAAAAFAKVDILVNNAGGAFAYTRFRKMAEWSEADWDMIQERNLRYLFLTCRAAINQMIAQGSGGAIVNIASISGVVSAPNHAAYGAAKGGVILLTKSLAAEYGPQGIRVNAVSPGSIMTPATARAGDDREHAYRDILPLTRAGRPEDIAKAVLFFASPLADYVTGQMLLVDGGASVRYPLPGAATSVS